MTRDTFSILFFIRRARLNKHGEAPILVRITVNGISQEAVVGRSIAPELWNQQAERATGKDRLSFEVNAYLDTMRSRIMQIHRQSVLLSVDCKVISKYYSCFGVNAGFVFGGGVRK